MKLNITSKLLGLFVVAALTLTACGDKDDDAQPATDTLTPCKVTSVTNSDGTTSDFEYNAAGYVTSITQVEVEDGIEYEYTSAYSYDSNNRLIKEEYLSDGEAYGYMTFEYANGLVSKTKEYYDGTLEYTATFTYDSSKRLVKITEVGQDEEEYSMTFTYNSAGNVNEAKVMYMGEAFITTKYENYDNKLIPYAAVKGLVNLYEGSSKNNPGKVTATMAWGEEPVTSVVTYTYQYNDKNLPTRVTGTYEEGDQDISNFTYQCN